MPASATSAAVCGGALGFMLQLYTNGVRKLPVLRNPWEHGIYTAVGACFGVSIINMEERLRTYIEEQTQARSRK